MLVQRQYGSSKLLESDGLMDGLDGTIYVVKNMIVHEGLTASVRLACNTACTACKMRQ